MSDNMHNLRSGPTKGIWEWKEEGKEGEGEREREGGRRREGRNYICLKGRQIQTVQESWQKTERRQMVQYRKAKGNVEWDTQQSEHECGKETAARPAPAPWSCEDPHEACDCSSLRMENLLFRLSRCFRASLKDSSTFLPGGFTLGLLAMAAREEMSPRCSKNLQIDPQGREAVA